MDTTPRYGPKLSPKQQKVRAEIERLRRQFKAQGVPPSLIRKMRISLKSYDATTNQMWFTISSTSVDMEMDVLIARAVHEAAQRRQRKHTIPFIDAHQATSIRNILGRVSTTRLSADGRSVEALVEFVDEKAFNLYANKFASDCSIGFRGVRWITVDQISTLSPQDQAALAGLDLRNVRRIFVEIELYEVSACCIGANTDAVAMLAAKSATPEPEIPAFVREAMVAIIKDALDGRTELVRWYEQQQAADDHLYAAWRNRKHLIEQEIRVAAELERQRVIQLRGGTNRRP